jgi:hypothetical protein
MHRLREGVFTYLFELCDVLLVVDVVLQTKQRH